MSLLFMLKNMLCVVSFVYQKFKVLYIEEMDYSSFHIFSSWDAMAFILILNVFSLNGNFLIFFCIKQTWQKQSI